jgi:hypothetical protein
VLQAANILSNAKPTEANRHLPIILETIKKIFSTCSEEANNIVPKIQNQVASPAKQVKIKI